MVWWLLSIIPGRQEDQKFKVILSYTASLRLAGNALDPVFKKKLLLARRGGAHL